MIMTIRKHTWKARPAASLFVLINLKEERIKQVHKVMC